VSGAELFWTSGTWIFFLAQGLVLVLVVFLYWYLGVKEKQAKEKNSSN